MNRNDLFVLAAFTSLLLMACDVFKTGPSSVSHLVRLGEGSITGMTWNPSGDDLAITNKLPGYTQVLFYHMQTRMLEAKFTGPNLSFEDWSPDGKSVLLAGAAGFATGDSRGGIWLLNLDDGSVQFLGDGESAAWAPDGTRIAVIDTSGDLLQIDTLDIRDLHRSALYSSQTSVAAVGDIRWSPDGKSLAYTHDAEASYGQDIFVLDTGAGSPVRLTNAGYNYSVAWSAKGDALAYVSSRLDWETPKVVVLRPVAPTCARSILGTEGAGYIAWSPAGLLVFSRGADIYMLDEAEISDLASGCQ